MGGSASSFIKANRTLWVSAYLLTKVRLDTITLLVRNMFKGDETWCKGKWCIFIKTMWFKSSISPKCVCGEFRVTTAAFQFCSSFSFLWVFYQSCAFLLIHLDCEPWQVFRRYDDFV
jgi:hypothetical protein